MGPTNGKMSDTTTPPADNQVDKGEQTPPADGGQAGQGNQNPQAPYNLPEKFKGKSTDEIVKAYVEAERKLGDMSTTVAEAKKLKEQTEVLLSAVWSDPDLYRQVENGIRKYMNGGKLPEVPRGDKPDEKGDEGADKTEVDPTVMDLKTSEENRVLNDFFSKYGYKNLDEKSRKDAYARLTMAIAEMVDPGGNKPIAQILKEIPTSRLSRYLENAHFLANKDQLLDNAKKSALLDQRSNDSATIGSFATSSAQPTQGVELTARERQIAQKMGISEEQYAKRKAQISSENKRFE